MTNSIPYFAKVEGPYSLWKSPSFTPSSLDEVSQIERADTKSAAVFPIDNFQQTTLNSYQSQSSMPTMTQFPTITTFPQTKLN